MTAVMLPSQLILLTAEHANKLGDEVLGAGIVALLGKSPEEFVTNILENHLTKIRIRLLSHTEGRTRCGSSCAPSSVRILCSLCPWDQVTTFL